MKFLCAFVLVGLVSCSMAATKRQLPLNFTLRPRFVDAFSTGFVSKIKFYDLLVAYFEISCYFQ